MQLVESERIEIKSRVTDKLCRTIVAFANASGGAIYVGIDDFGETIGVLDVDGEMLRVSSMIHDCIRPDMSELVEIEPIEHEGKNLIKVTVESGSEKPYYLATKGPVPAGVFTRLGPATVSVDRRGIRRMIRDADGLQCEDEHSGNQDLTFKTAQRVFSDHGLTFDKTTLENLGIIGRDGFYTNLGLLISDQNPFELRCAIFNDDALTDFINRRDCEGSVFDQFEEAERFLDMANGLKSYIVDGQIQRIDKRDYPADAIREGILNALIHRAYDPRSPVLIKMSRTELHFTNYGGLATISVEDAIAGSTEARNPKLRALFYRLGLLEALGTGLDKIYRLYREEELEPSIVANENWFHLVLPNVNTTRNPRLSLTRNDGPSLRGGYDDYKQLYDEGALPPEVARAFEKNIRQRNRKLAAAARSQEQDAAARNKPNGKTTLVIQSTESIDGHTVEHILFALGRENGGAFSRQEAEEALGMGRDMTLKVINGMLGEGKLVKEGNARATRYCVARA